MIYLSYVSLVVLILLSGSSEAGRQLDSLAPTHPKYMTTKQVFNDLVRAIGDGRTKPALRVQPEYAGGTRAAWFTPKLNVVTIDERFYDLCVSLGPDSLDALAAVLGHELAHYYKDHAWSGDFSSTFGELDIGRAIAMLEFKPGTRERLETEADQFGGFYGFVAGYNTLGTATKMLEAVYREYGLEEKLEGYAALAERQAIAEMSLAQLRELIPVFDAGNRLLLIAKYEEAARCFDWIGRTFGSREILNNRGVARTLDAVRLFPKGELRFAYPVELDPSTRVRGGQKASVSEPLDLEALESMQRRQTLLDEAADLFDQASSRDANYATAWINRACVADMQGESEDALFFADKAIRMAGKNVKLPSLGNALIARGIAYARGVPPDEEQARRDFEKALSSNPALAQFNIDVLTGSSPVVCNSKAKSHGKNKETIDKLTVEEISDRTAGSPDVIATLPRVSRSQPFVAISAKQTTGWSGLTVEIGYTMIAFAETRDDYEGHTARGLKVGQSLGEMRQAYGQSARDLAGSRSTYHVYDDYGIIFYSKEDSVQGWITYMIDWQE